MRFLLNPGTTKPDLAYELCYIRGAGKAAPSQTVSRQVAESSRREKQAVGVQKPEEGQDGEVYALLLRCPSKGRNHTDDLRGRWGSFRGQEAGLREGMACLQTK